MTTFSLRSIRIRPGEEFRHELPVELEPFVLAGQRYEPRPTSPDARLAITRTASGTLFQLRFRVSFAGPCFRCLEDAVVWIDVDSSEYEASDAGSDDELRTPYLAEGILDLSSWARDAIALELPEQILCRADCAGLCDRCGSNLNEGPCGCPPPAGDPRWDKLAGLREKLGEG